jgi:branched-chain amino acid transport system substrate-binding protein
MIRILSRLTVALFVAALFCSACGDKGSPTPIVIGVNAPLSGDVPQIGESTRAAVELWLADVEAAGGIEIEGVRHPVRVVVRDNHADPASAVEVTSTLIAEDRALVIVGPQASSQAVPAGGAANDARTPMISPWSTNPNTTLDRPWVFRASFLDSFQGPLVAKFVSRDFGFTRAAVLYDPDSDYPRDLAQFFRDSWQEIHGPDSVVANETFSAGETDFSAQITHIMESGAEFVFLPQYYNQVAAIVPQAHALGLKVPFVGSDSWGSAALTGLCGDDCTGLFFSTHFAAVGATGATKVFVDRYKAEYGYLPDDVAALTWDSMNIVQQAVRDCGMITGDLAADRTCVRDAMARIKSFAGITGDMTFTEEGDPIKCGVIVRINEAGEFQFYESVCP